jgi:hypothetical protein
MNKLMKVVLVAVALVATVSTYAQSAADKILGV